MFDTRNRRTCRSDLRARVVGSSPRGFELGRCQQPSAEQLLLPAELLFGVSRTRFGSQVAVTFTIGRDGTVTSIHLSQGTASPTLNTTAVQAVQRVQTFGPLPDQYTGTSVSVEYTFTYDQPSR